MLTACSVYDAAVGQVAGEHRRERRRLDASLEPETGGAFPDPLAAIFQLGSRIVIVLGIIFAGGARRTNGGQADHLSASMI